MFSNKLYAQNMVHLANSMCSLQSLLVHLRVPVLLIEYNLENAIEHQILKIGSKYNMFESTC